MFADSLNNNDNSRVKNEYMKSGSSGLLGTKPKSTSKPQDSVLESARSSESGEESRDISRSRRARVEQQQAKRKVKLATDNSLLFDAAVKFYLRKVLSRMTAQLEKLDTFGQFTEEYYACTNSEAYTAHHLTSDEEWSIGLPVLIARVKSYQYDCVNDFRHDFREMVTARLRSDALPPFSAEYQSSESMLYEGLKLIGSYQEYLNDKTVQQHYLANKQFDFKIKHVIAAIVERESDSACLLCGEEKTKHCLECRLCHDTYHTACLRMIDKHVPETDRNKWHCEKCQLLDQHHHMRQYLNQAATPQSPLTHHGTLTAFTLNIDTSQNKHNKKRKRTEDKEEEDPPQKKRRVTHRVKLPRATQQTVDPDKIKNNKDYARSIKWEPVDRVVGRRLCNKIVQYKVMWRNKSAEEAKWVYHYQMQDCEEFVRDFETKFADLIKKKQLETQMKRQKEGDKNKS